MGREGKKDRKLETEISVVFLLSRTPCEHHLGEHTFKMVNSHHYQLSFLKFFAAFNRKKKKKGLFGVKGES